MGFKIKFRIFVFFFIFSFSQATFSLSDSMAKKIYKIDFIKGKYVQVFEDGKIVQLTPERMEEITSEEKVKRAAFEKEPNKKNFDELDEEAKLSYASQIYHPEKTPTYNLISEKGINEVLKPFFSDLDNDDKPEVISRGISSAYASCVFKKLEQDCLTDSTNRIKTLLALLARYNSKYLKKTICSMTEVFSRWMPGEGDIVDLPSKSDNLPKATILVNLMETSKEFADNKYLECTKDGIKYGVQDKILNVKNIMKRPTVKVETSQNVSTSSSMYYCNSEKAKANVLKAFETVEKKVIGFAYFTLSNDPDCAWGIHIKKVGRNKFEYTPMTSDYKSVVDPIPFTGRKGLDEKIFGIKDDEKKPTDTSVKLIDRPNRAGK